MKIQSFQIIGISVRTTNENGQAAQDIPALWYKFISENIIDQIPNKVDNTLYCVYTNYEKDHTKPYTTILGCKVSSIAEIPENMMALTIKEANYAKYIAKGDLNKGAVFNKWAEIWTDVSIDRAFTADFEVYNEKAKDPNNAEVDIFIAVK
jgi:predicted transcriptional regulator YdeE